MTRSIDGPVAPCDVHQHLWPRPLVEALRSRPRAPRLDGWRLHLAGEPPYEVRAEDHDLAGRAAAEPVGQISLVSLSAPLGIEHLPTGECEALLDAWRTGAAEFPANFRSWASVGVREPDLDQLRTDLEGSFVGLQLGADLLATPAMLECIAPVLEVCASANAPLLVHPGPVRLRDWQVPRWDDAPVWWPAVVDYPTQLSAAWWSWHVAGRALAPGLRVCFVAGAGLAPLQHERLVARGGDAGVVDRDVFVDTSSYGPQAIDGLIRARGIDTVVLGSDRPYAEPIDCPALGLGDAAMHAIATTNPFRLLHGGAR